MTGTSRHFLDVFFNPRSVAVVGASRTMSTANYWLAANLVSLKYPGRICPVNPNTTELLGLKCYPSVRDIPHEIDLAAISVPARACPDVVRDCVAKGVKAIVIIAGGFSETGADGQGLQDEIKQLLKGSGIRCVGPNSLSPANSALNFIIGFGPVESLPKGRLSFVFQSGLYQPRLNYLLNDLHINIAKLLDLGNKMDVNEVDALEYLAQDAATTVICLHLESIAGDARRFLRLLRETTPRKPVIVLKSGRTPAGAKAASSHTGAIIKASDVVFNTAFRQAGAIRVQGLDEFFDLAKAFEYCPPMEGNRIAIASFSGGEGVITTDFCYLHGLDLANPTDASRQKLKSIFPPWEIPVNPYDTGVGNQFNPGVDVVSKYMDILADDPNVDCLAVQIGGPPQMAGFSVEDRLAKTVDLYRSVVRRGKHVVAWVIDPRGTNRDMINALEAARIPTYPSAERAVRAMGALHRYAVIRRAAAA